MLRVLVAWALERLTGWIWMERATIAMCAEALEHAHRTAS